MTKTSFDADGRVKFQTNGVGFATEFGYDELGHLSAITDPLARTTRFEYDGAGNRASMVDAQNQTTAYSYDLAHRLTGIDYSTSEARAIDDVQYSYDVLGRRREMKEIPAVGAPRSTTYTYDSLGRLTSHVRNGRTTDYGYDLAGRLVNLVYPHLPSDDSPRTVTRSYDAAGRLTGVTDWRPRTTSFGYDADGNLTTTNFPNGVTTSKEWDRSGYVSRITHDNHGGRLLDGTSSDRVILDFPYGRDRDGRLISENPAGTGDLPSLSYHYDVNGRLVGGGVPSALAEVPAYGYTYSDADELTSMSVAGVSAMSYDPAGQLMERQLPGGATELFTYDSRGNRTRREVVINGTSAEVGDTYSYDQANRLTGDEMVLPYNYDGDGLRSDLKWDFSQPLPLIIGDLTSWYITGPGGLPLEKLTLETGVTPSAGPVTSDPTLWYHQDQLGSTNAVSDSKGRFLTTYTYDPYGKATPSNTGVVNPFQFAGQYADLETGLLYMRARWYDPATGQFLTRDPIEAQTREPYGYVGGDPLNRTDPMGLCWGPGCWAEEAVGAVAAVARSGPAQAVKDMASVASTVTAGIAAVSATAAVVLPFTAPVTAPAAFLAEGVSLGTGAVATAIECSDGGNRFDCLAGLAATSIPGVAIPLVKQVARRDGDRASRLLNAGINNLGFAGNGAALAGSQRERQVLAQPVCP